MSNIFNSFNECIKYGYCSSLENNSLAVLGSIFVIVFTISFLSLTQFFSKKQKKVFPWDSEKTVVENKRILVIISLAIAFLTVYYLKDSIILEHLRIIFYIFIIVIFLAIAKPFWRFFKQI